MAIPNFLKEQIALGKRPYADKYSLLGNNAAVGTSFEALRASSAAYTQLTSAVAMEVVSGSGDDDAAGTGAQTVTVVGLDANYDKVTETVSMDGTTPVALGTNLLAVNEVYVATAGSGLVNAGAIDVRTVSGSTVQKRIAASEGREHDFLFTVPAGHIALLGSINVHVAATGSSGTTEAVLSLHNSSGLVKFEGRVKTTVATDRVIDLGTGLVVPEKTLIQVQVKDSVGSAVVCAEAELLVFNAKEFGFI